MLSFTAEQLAATDALAVQRFSEDLVAFVARHAAEAGDDASDAEVRAAVTASHARALQLGMERRDAVSTFVLYSWVYGADFSKEPEIARLLRDPRMVDAHMVSLPELLSAEGLARLEARQEADDKEAGDTWEDVI